MRFMEGEYYIFKSFDKWIMKEGGKTHAISFDTKYHAFEFAKRMKNRPDNKATFHIQSDSEGSIEI